MFVCMCEGFNGKTAPEPELKIGLEVLELGSILVGVQVAEE